MSSVTTPLNYVLDRATATTTIPQPVQVYDASKDVVITFTSEGTTSGGTLIIEESDLRSYTGTWSKIGATINASDFNGVKQCYHIRMGAGMWLRVRIATTITGGGTVTVTVAGM
jgi:hypothetical protein